jgi:hypothetical protein
MPGGCLPFRPELTGFDPGQVGCGHGRASTKSESLPARVRLPFVGVRKRPRKTIALADSLHGAKSGVV